MSEEDADGDPRRIGQDIIDGTVSHIVVDGVLYRVQQDDYNLDPYLVELGGFDESEATITND